MKLIQDTIIIFQSQHTFCLKQFIPYICMGILIDTGSYSWYLLLKLPFKPFVCNYTTKCIQNTAQTKIRRLHSTVITWKIHSSATNHWQSNITVIPIVDRKYIHNLGEPILWLSGGGVLMMGIMALLRLLKAQHCGPILKRLKY